MQLLYKYPQRAFPYDELVRVNGERTREDLEYELLGTGAVLSSGVTGLRATHRSRHHP